MKYALSSLPALLAAGCLAGCVTGTDFNIPSNAVAQRPDAKGSFIGVEDSALSRNRLPDHWWQLYNGPKLDAYVSEALGANTDLRVAVANLRRTRAFTREAETAHSASIAISGQALGAKVSGPTASLPARLSYSLGFDLGYSLDLAGSVQRRVEAANEQAEVSVAGRDQMRLLIVAAVTRNYAKICATNVSLAAARHVTEIQQSTLEVAARLSRDGRGTQFEVDRARSAAYASNASIHQFTADRQAALFELASLMGRTANNFPREAQTCSAILSVGRPIPIGDGAMLIKRRPDIRMAEHNLAAATAMIGITEAELYPNVSIMASAGTVAPLNKVLSPSSFGISLGPVLTWSFPNRKLVRSRIDQANADAEAAFAKFDGAVLMALQQTETAITAYVGAFNTLKDLTFAADAATKASEVANKLHSSGRTSFFDVLNAQAANADVQTKLAAARAIFVDRQIELFIALGGGWE